MVRDRPLSIHKAHTLYVAILILFATELVSSIDAKLRLVDPLGSDASDSWFRRSATRRSDAGDSCTRSNVIGGPQSVGIPDLEEGSASSFQRICAKDPCDLSWDCVLQKGILKPNELNKVGPWKPSVIMVNASVVESALEDGMRFTKVISDRISSFRIHTPAHSNVDKGYFNENARWYQEQGNTQIFRLFEGEYNIRNANRGKSAARIEAFSKNKNSHWSSKFYDDTVWHQFEGLFSLIQPQDAHLFQIYSPELQWTVTLSMIPNGDLVLMERGDMTDGNRILTKKTVILTREDMTSNADHPPQFLLKAMDNGRRTKIFVNHELVSDFTDTRRAVGRTVKKSGKTDIIQVEKVKWQFRWGTYVQSKQTMDSSTKNTCHDSLIFVSGARLSTMRETSSPTYNPTEQPTQTPVTEEPTEHPTMATTETMCSKGIFSEDNSICCNKKCGQCGGAGCGPAGESVGKLCCKGTLKKRGKICKDAKSTGCIIARKIM